MGDHIIDGEFQSDKYPTCPRGKVPLSVKDKTAQDLLWEYAQRRRAVDPEFSDDLETVLKTAGYSPGYLLKESHPPVPMLLPCPCCGRRHVDESDFATKVHHTHSCQFCGHTWRPAIQATVGVQFLPGYKNVPEPPPAPYALNVWVVMRAGHRPYVSTIEHTPGYFDMVKADGAYVYRAEILLPGFVLEDGIVQGRAV